MAYEYITSEHQGAVALITLNRPEKLNALSFPLMEELDRALTGYEQDDDIKAVILTGAGERAFSAGADIHEMADLSSEELARRSDTRGRVSWHIASYTKPLIGAINGLAYGGAALLSSSLDLRIGCERTQFRFLAASYGRVNSTWSLPALVGIPKAKELLYTGRVAGGRSRAHRPVEPGRPLREADRVGGRDRSDDRQERRPHGAGDQAPLARGHGARLAGPLRP